MTSAFDAHLQPQPLQSTGRYAGKWSWPRIVLYFYVLLIACPIRYFPFTSGLDATWLFALNYAHVAGLQPVFTNGPLSYLILPQHIGNNLSQGLVFQLALWLVLAFIFAEIFFRSGYPLKNLLLFSFCLALASPLFWFDYFGVENLILAGALLLIMRFRFSDSWTRYLIALVLIGSLPLLKWTAGLIGVGALAGFLVDRIFWRKRSVVTVIVITVLVPLAVAAGGIFWALPSYSAILDDMRSSREVITGYAAAMSLPLRLTAVLSAFEVVCLLIAGLVLYARRNAAGARFYALLFAVPVIISFKHGFTRSDAHVANFFCFAALAFALITLTIDVDRKSMNQLLLLILIFAVIWQDRILPLGLQTSILPPTGGNSLLMLGQILRSDRPDPSMASIPVSSRLEPDLVRLIGDSPVASLSNDYVNLAVARTKFTLLPVIQRYAAYTPYLDNLNAAWIRERGPEFLVFDGASTDDRDPWAETPGMWLEVYRWYNTRLLGSRNLLLQRRSQPRFKSLQEIARFRMTFPGELRLPVSDEVAFWTMHCDYSTRGRLENLILAGPMVFMSVTEQNGSAQSKRVFPLMLTSPVPGKYLPGNLSEFADLFRWDARPAYQVTRISFDIPERGTYQPNCDVRQFLPVY
jgi:hypothetical protein